MIDFNAGVLSGKALGNVFLGENIKNYINELYAGYKVSYFEYFLPDDERRLAYTINDTMTIAALANGTIISIGGNVNYKGRYNNILQTGQTMRDIIKLTYKQRVFNGCIIINDDFGFSFELPAPYDEIADSIAYVPLDLVLNEIRVADYSDWNFKKQNAER
ncbi:hypothetical protein L2X67_22250 [Enterobacter ludwigii]|nr:hypothetical protein [Enterobacter ludwigii]